MVKEIREVTVQMAAEASAFRDARRWWLVLPLICAAQFMIVLDVTIVNVALPSIQQALGFSRAGLQWVVTAYALAFGGFLLLGGRAADLFGRRRLFMAGLASFAVASAGGGLAQAGWVLIAARALQGLGAAMVAPAALSLITTSFAEGAERNKALGIFGGIVSAGFAAGVLLGGVLTQTFGWEWVFFVNVPVGALAFALAPTLIAESRVRGSKGEGRGVDVWGALLVTAALVSLVFGVSRAEGVGFGAPVTLLPLALAVVLLGVFVAVERRLRAPLVRLGIFRKRTLAGANTVGVLVPGAFGSALLILTLYMQQGLGFGALSTGLAFLPMALVVLLFSKLAPRIVDRLGIKPVLAAGTAAMALGLVLFALLASSDGAFATSLLVPMIVTAAGFGTTVSAATIAAVAGVGAEEQGLASGLFNSAQQVGSATWVAVLTVVAAARTGALEAGGRTGTGEALVGGFAWAFAAGAGIVALALLAVLFVVPGVERE